MNYANAAFERLWNETNETIQFDESWNNGTGYFDKAVKVKLKPGQVVRSECPNDRMIMMVGTAFGTIVVFQRYSGGDRGIITRNDPKEINELFHFDNVLSENDLVTIFGTVGFPNIGLRLERLRNDPVFCLT